VSLGRLKVTPLAIRRAARLALLPVFCPTDLDPSRTELDQAEFKVRFQVF
jgi:hypothetical protein